MLSATRRMKNKLLSSVNNLIFFMFIRSPASIWVKQLIHISMNCARGFLHNDFSNMTQSQRARYRVARNVIVNDVTTATLESKMKNA